MELKTIEAAAAREAHSSPKRRCMYTGAVCMVDWPNLIASLLAYTTRIYLIHICKLLGHTRPRGGGGEKDG